MSAFFGMRLTTFLIHSVNNIVIPVNNVLVKNYFTRRHVLLPETKP
jgi:hypothetical protein